MCGIRAETMPGPLLSRRKTQAWACPCYVRADIPYRVILWQQRVAVEGERAVCRACRAEKSRAARVLREKIAFACKNNGVVNDFHPQKEPRIGWIPHPCPLHFPLNWDDANGILIKKA